MSERMTDERLAWFWGTTIADDSYAAELLQALKAERERIEQLEADCVTWSDSYDKVEAENEKLEAKLEKAEAKLKRLESRGFQDLHHENEQLQAQIEAVKEQITLMPQSGSGYDYWVNALLTALKESKDE